VRLDHVLLAPGSAWPYRAQWRQFAQELPADTVLLIPPAHTLPLRPVLEQLARLLQAEGQQHPKGYPCHRRDATDRRPLQLALLN
jgi:hypothetical protein